MAAEESLDPPDWNAARALGRDMVDEMLTWLETVRERPVWQPIPPAAREFLTEPLPREGQGLERVYEDFRRHVLPHPLGNVHPRFWGWVIGTGSGTGALAEMLAAAMNPNVGGGDQIANHLELEVLGWLKEMMGFPPTSSGLLVSGGSMANLVGLTVARNAKAEADILEDGLAAAPRPMVLYASRETHNSVRKAVGLLGLGRRALREIAVDAEFRIDVAALRRAVAEDRKAGRHPFCVVGNAATVNTGAFDDLPALADLCRDEGLWFHVDGAFGALPAISPALRPLVRGMDRADSLAFDLHKWMYMPFEAGCALVRHSEEHYRSFTVPADYLSHTTRGIAAAPVWLSDYGVQLTRGFRALKVWMLLKEHGVDKYARLLEQNVAQALYLASLVEASPELELLAPVPLNIVCFRYRDPRLDDAALDRLNEEILGDLQEEGIAVPSATVLGGRYALRVCIVNHRSRREDFDLLVAEVLRRGREKAARAATVHLPAADGP